MKAESGHVSIIGGGASGFFAAITCAERLHPSASITVFERGPQFLQKVKISGGGRCNVTHACFDPKALTTRYPRGSRELISAFHRFQAQDTVNWFAGRGVQLKTEPDGRMFPTTDQSETIVQCLMQAAKSAGVELRANSEIQSIQRKAAGGFSIHLSKGETVSADCVLLATGGCRSESGGSLAAGLGHTLAPPVPSLFTFHIKDSRLDGLSGLAVESAQVCVPGSKLRETGPVLITHWGLSGPAILRLSAWGARELHALDYRFTLRINWLGGAPIEAALSRLQRQRELAGSRHVANAAPAQIPSRLWERLVRAAEVPATMKWAQIDRVRLQALARQLTGSDFQVTGKSLNKDEFVTCGGVKLNEVNFKTMESRICPGLYFAGELLDIDGITGGFNFQAAWTTSWIAGNAMAESLENRQTSRADV